MPRLKEDLLQFIWQQRLLKPSNFISQGGNEIKIIKQGELNKNAGPDFFNARIAVNGIELVGNIEIHVRTSDWIKHKHQHDKSYDTIILHVVYEHDLDLDQNTNNHVEVLELKNLMDESLITRYDGLLSSKSKLPCSSQLKLVGDLKLLSWMERMMVERLEYKTKRMERFFEIYRGDYSAVFYNSLLRNFGFHVNAVPFELLAGQLPFQILLKHADNLLQLEALLLGTAGFLEDQFQEPYILRLQNEFEHLKHKYKLVPLQKNVFKFSRLRPANFPDFRLAQFAQLLNAHPQFLTDPQGILEYKELISLLTLPQQGYWKDHYKLDGKILSKNLSFGVNAAENIMINTIAPFLFFYAKRTQKTDSLEKAIALLTHCNWEKNAKTELFSIKKQVLNTAAYSQGVINLYDNYCSKKLCLKCGIAATLLKSA